MLLPLLARREPTDVPTMCMQDHLRWSLAWLDCHASLARQLLRKPLVLSEFGKQRRRSAADGGARSQWYSQVGLWGEAQTGQLASWRVPSEGAVAMISGMGKMCSSPCAVKGRAGEARLLLPLRPYARILDQHLTPQPPILCSAAALRSPQQLLAHALHLMRAGSGLAGSAFWLLAAPSYPDHDGFTVYLDSIGSQLSSSRQLSGVAARAALAPQAGGRTADAIRRHAAEVGDLNGGPARVQPGGLPGGWLGNPLLAGGSASGSMGAAATAGSSGGAGSSASLDCAQSAHCRCCPQM